MTAYVFGSTTIGSSLIYSSAAINDSVTFLQGLTFFNTNTNAVNILHGNNTVYNSATVMSGGTYGLVVNTVNDCEIVNTATGTIGTLAGFYGYSAVYLAGDRNLLLNSGRVFSANGTAVTAQGDDYFIDNRGMIEGHDAGITALGEDYTIMNSGTIQAGTGPEPVAVLLSGAGTSKSLINTGIIQSLNPAAGIGVQVLGYNLTTVNNSGTILSVGGIAIDASTATGAIHLTNSGSIVSSTNYTLSVAGTALADVIINTGTINRSVALGDGDDIFNGIGGQVGGTVFGGDGNDIYGISDPLALVFEDIGQGTNDVIESTVSFSLAATGEVEGLTLLGAATDGTGNGYANLITGNGMDNRLLGDAGLDTIHGGNGNDWIDSGTEADLQFGGNGDDRLMGRWSGDTLYGGDGDDLVKGDAASDRIYGDGGEDVLVGGAGRDWLYGGAEADVFLFRRTADSGLGTTLRDLILGFEAGSDLVDLTQIDANASTSGNQAFAWIGTAAFGSIAGQLRVLAGANSILQGDVNGDGLADFELQFNAMATVSQNDILL